MRLTDEAAEERQRIIAYLRMRARIWSAETVRNMDAYAGMVGAQLDLVATEIREGSHWIDRMIPEDEDGSND